MFGENSVCIYMLQGWRRLGMLVLNVRTGTSSQHWSATTSTPLVLPSLPWPGNQIQFMKEVYVMPLSLVWNHRII